MPRLAWYPVVNKMTCLRLRNAPEFLFQGLVNCICAIGDTRSGGAGSEFFKRCDTSRDARLVERDAHIVVGARQHGFNTVDDRARRRQYLIHSNADRIGAHRQHKLVPLGQTGVFF